jgi:hypothetical protein
MLLIYISENKFYVVVYSTKSLDTALIFTNGAHVT